MNGVHKFDRDISPPFRFEPLLDTQQAAALLGIHPKTLQKLARSGKVPSHRIGDLWRFRASELDIWLRTGVHSAPPLVP
jgi:excisionase family DNA binding protein